MMIDDPVMSRKSASGQARRRNEPEQPLVVILDDDRAVREALHELMLSAGMECVCFESTRELLEADALGRPGCLILDVRMPGSSGLDLQHHLAANGNRKPIVFLTGHGDIPMTVQAMKAGAVDFLTKPVRDQALLDAVTAGIQRDIAQRAEALIVKRNVERLETLTPRERRILHDVSRGRVNKQIAFDLGISEVTVKFHRGKVMRKMQAASIGELIRIWESLPTPKREACAT
jgi:FixJ family two-component response regulator